MQYRKFDLKVINERYIFFLIFLVIPHKKILFKISYNQIVNTLKNEWSCQKFLSQKPPKFIIFNIYPVLIEFRLQKTKFQVEIKFIPQLKHMLQVFFQSKCPIAVGQNAQLYLNIIFQLQVNFWSFFGVSCILGKSNMILFFLFF